MKSLKNSILSAAFSLVASAAIMAQGVAVSETNATPDPSAALDVQSVTKGVLVPRMTAAQRNAIAAPANGLVVFQTNNLSTAQNGYWYYDATIPAWVPLGLNMYTGSVEQPNTLVNTINHTATVTSLDVGETELGWTIPSITSPPTVLVIPEYTVVGTPPAITDYCQPTPGGCNNSSIYLVHVYYPESGLTTANPQTNPPMVAASNSCGGAGNPNSDYNYVPTTGGSYASNGISSFNSLNVDFCTGSGELGFRLLEFAVQPRSFTFFMDLNQDGDFSDPGELLAQFSSILPSVGPNYFFGSSSSSFYPPIAVPITAVNGTTKLRIVARSNGAPATTNPCINTSFNTSVYDFDVDITCATGGTPIFPSDLNWCNVSDITNNTARVSCFDKEGAPTDLKYHYKIVSHD